MGVDYRNQDIHLDLPFYFQVMNASKKIILLRWVEQSLERLASCRLPRGWMLRIQLSGKLRAAVEKVTPFLYALGDLLFFGGCCVAYVMIWRAVWL